VHAAGSSEGGRRESSLLTFAALFVSEKREKRKVILCFFAGENFKMCTKTLIMAGESFD
jgi:hypothetical protein